MKVDDMLFTSDRGAWAKITGLFVCGLTCLVREQCTSFFKL